jgi:hypothetical protein
MQDQTIHQTLREYQAIEMLASSEQSSHYRERSRFQKAASCTKFLSLLCHYHTKHQHIFIFLPK